MQRLYSHLFCWLVLITLSGCNETINNNSIDIKPASDTVSLSINKDEKGKYGHYTWVTTIASTLKLDSLALGYDSLQIRVWGGLSSLDTGRVLIIHRKNSNWSGQLVRIIFSQDLTDPFTPVGSNTQNVIPKSGWPAFINKLYELKVLTLPDMRDAGYGPGEDGGSYCVEVATKNTYRFYRYWGPESHAKEFWQAKNMVDIVTLIESEFDFKYFP